MKRLTTLLAFALYATAASACGPFFPGTFFTTNQRDIMTMPRGLFGVEYPVVCGQERDDPLFQQDTPKTDVELRAHSVEVDLAEFVEAVAKREDGAELVKEYTAMRNALAAYREDTKAQEKPFDLTPYEGVLGKIPSEFARYLRGAAAYASGDNGAAITQFASVLELPAEERAYRSVWAAFMLGKSDYFKEPAKAPAAYAQARALAAEGFRDALGLAADSLGWQAQAECKAGLFREAIAHYHEYGQRGPENYRVALLSLEKVCERALKPDTVDPALAADPLCRRIITAWVVSSEDDPKSAGRWLAAVDAHMPQDTLEGADRLAWAAYRAGDMQRAQRWLDHAPADAPYAQWVRAKLLLRQGKPKEAAEQLRTAPEHFPGSPGWMVEDESDWWDKAYSRSLALQDLGFLWTSLGNYACAVEAFQRGGDWQDAGFIADRIMTLEELRACVDQAACKEPLPERLKRDANDDRDDAAFLRYMLARRLARAGRWQEAIPYYPKTLKGLFIELYMEPREVVLQEQAKAVVEHLAAAEDSGQADRDRAQHYFDAARILREWGMELIGTEESPDWRLFNGVYAPEDDRERPNRSLLPADFQTRYAASAPSPDKRFHYRYQASDLMMRCAELLPDNDVLTAKALYYGGLYLRSDPAAADRFYKALVRRNPNLEIARQADQLRWFPPEFSEKVLYQPLPRHFWKGRVHVLAVSAGAALLAIVLVTGLLRARRRCPSSEP